MQITKDEDNGKETQTEVVWTCLPFIRPVQNHLARHSERGKTTSQTEARGEKTTSMNGQVKPQMATKKRKMEEIGCEVICGAPMTLS